MKSLSLFVFVDRVIELDRAKLQMRAVSDSEYLYYMISIE